MAGREAGTGAVLRALAWVLRLALFLLLLGFALKNSELVTVRFYLGYEWQATLVLVMLIAFAGGAAFGVLACLPALFRQRRRIAWFERGAARARDKPPPSQEAAP